MELSTGEVFTQEEAAQHNAPSKPAVSLIDSPDSVSKILPTFLFEQIISSVIVGLKPRKAPFEKQGSWSRRKEREERQRRAREAERRGQKSDMWTTPGQVPLIMAPAVCREEFEKENLKSDSFTRSYTQETVQRSYENLHGENEIMGVNHNWLKEVSNDDNIDPARRKFYKHLKREVSDDFREIWYELDLMNDYSILQRFEFRELDADAGTTKLEGLLHEGEVPAFEDDLEVQAKYGYLLRDKYPPLSRLS